MKRTDLGGDELQRRVRIEGGEPPPSFWQVIETQIAECASVIREHGIDCAEDRLTDFGSLLNENSKGRAEPYTDLWYAAELGWRCLNLWLDRDEKQSEVQLGRIMQIGMLGTEWNWRTRYKPEILTGTKVQKRLAEHRDRAIKKKRTPMWERQEEILELLPRATSTGSRLVLWLKTQLAKEEHGEHKVSKRTIRRDLDKLKKQGHIV